LGSAGVEMQSSHSLTQSTFPAQRIGMCFTGYRGTTISVRVVPNTSSSSGREEREKKQCAFGAVVLPLSKLEVLATACL
jgi:hypothetical protein